MNMIQKLRSLADEIVSAKSPQAVDDAWALVGRLIGRTPADASRAQAVVESRDAGALHALLDELEGKGAPQPPAEAPTPGAPADFAHDDLAAAMRAFKKRLKLARLNEESRLGANKLSSGKKSAIDAIRPPSEYPDAMWAHLAREGRLVDQGGGFYGLPG